ncbi:MAG: hypothetical protein V7647_2701 [Acidobacteriota bacterium]
MLDTDARATYDRVVRAILALVVILSAATASAQTAFIQGGAGRDIRRFSGDAETSVFDGSAGSFTAAVGGHVLPHWILSAEFDAGQRSSQSTTTTVTINGLPRDIHTSYASDRRSLSALVGYETTARHRVQFVYAAGLSFTTFRRDISSDGEEIVLQSPAPGSRYTSRLSGAIAGVDTVIHIAPHLALVPGVRVQGLAIDPDLGAFSIRPSAAARISF